MRNLKDGPEVLTVRQAAEVWQVHPETVRRAIRDGSLPAFRARGTYRIPRTALERLIDEAVNG
jgi:excisionase family DNA binding protein